MSKLERDVRSAASETVAETNTAVEDVINLMRQMVLVIEEENGILSQGIPASLTSTSTRKNELADRFEEWVARVKSAQIRVDCADLEVRARLLSGTKALRDAMNENVVRLRIAMEASRRRVEAVMNAIREQMSSNSPYGANGRINDRAAQSTYGGVGRSI